MKLSNNLSFETHVLEVQIKSEYHRSAHTLSNDNSMTSAPFKTDISGFSP